MHDEPLPRPGVTPVTWLGLFLALFGLLIIRQVGAVLWPTPNFAWALGKESLVWLCALALLVIIWRGEHLPLSSIGVAATRWKQSLCWGFILALICGLVATALSLLANAFFPVSHASGAPDLAVLQSLPLWLVSLIVLRAGVVEEFFYRGYAIERLQSLGLKRLWAAAIPLAIFAGAHFPLGWPNVFVALALGAVLTASYLWRRDLVANMIAHCLVDFVGVVLPRLLAHT
ncbi:MAG: CPBP family intramembrane glutamic endopeptidase [Chthoniobacterales bacterium]